MHIAHERLRRVQCDCDTVFNVIQRYDTPDTFFFIDPPYIMDTRKKGGYDYEMTNEDHIKLVDMLMNIKGKAILCGYDHEIYDPLNQSDNWQRLDIARIADCAGTTKKQRENPNHSLSTLQRRKESFWLNYRLEDRENGGLFA